MLYFICHTSSGTSGEEEKGQSQKVDQKVSLCFILLFLFLLLVFIYYYFIYLGVNYNFKNENIRLDLRRTACMYTTVHS